MTDGFVADYLSYLLGRASHVVYTEFYTELRAAGVGSLEWRVLATLADERPRGIGDLATEVLAKQPTLTKLVLRLAAQGLVQREEHPDDRRRTLVRLTSRGANRVRPLIERARAHEALLLQDFSQRDRAALKRILRSLIARWDART
jgi:DNA-binding MarR family transcriptional regulator